MGMTVPEMYGSLVFNDKVMRDKLPKDIYKALRKTIDTNTHLEIDVANAVAFFAAEQSSYLTGQVLCADGGMAM